MNLSLFCEQTNSTRVIAGCSGRCAHPSGHFQSPPSRQPGRGRISDPSKARALLTPSRSGRCRFRPGNQIPGLVPRTSRAKCRGRSLSFSRRARIRDISRLGETFRAHGPQRDHELSRADCRDWREELEVSRHYELRRSSRSLPKQSSPIRVPVFCSLYQRSGTKPSGPRSLLLRWGNANTPPMGFPP